MKNFCTLALLISLLAISKNTIAQTRVFKEVGGAIKTQLNTIRQDNQLIGYLAFTQLEKASADSFNYRITIMDENLNDIGVVNFKELSLKLQGVSFESDIICVAYTRSPLGLEDPKLKRKGFNDIMHNQKNDIGIFFQFLTLEGVISNTLMMPEDIASFSQLTLTSSKGVASTSTRNPLQMQNVKDKGFVVYYGNGHMKNNSLLFVKTDGTKIWQKKLPNFESYVLQTASTGIHLLGQPHSKVHYGGEPDTRESNEILSYEIETGKAFKTIKLRDKKQNDLKLLGFRTNPATGRLNVLGMIANPELKYYPTFYSEYTKQPFTGLFSMDFYGLEKNEIKTVYNYFEEGTNAQFFDRKVRLTEDKSYLLFDNAFMDSEGNTYFGSSKVTKKPRYGSIVASVVTLPLIIPTIGIATIGYVGYRQTGGQVLTLQSDGKIKFNKSFENSNSFKERGSSIFSPVFDFQYAKGLTGEDYFLIADKQKLSIYHIKQDTVIRTIALKAGSQSLNIFPAKEGYFMVQQYNKSDRSTSLSIESL